MMMRRKKTAICWWQWRESWHFWLRSTLFHSLTPFTMNDQTQICLLFGPCPNVSVCSCTQWIVLEIYNSQLKNPLSQKLKQDKYVFSLIADEYEANIIAIVLCQCLLLQRAEDYSNALLQLHAWSEPIKSETTKFSDDILIRSSKPIHGASLVLGNN